jgi:hypothetical protein
LLYLLANQTTLDFWHDPLTLTILGVIATLLAALVGASVAYFIFRRQSIKKLISYQIVSNAPIATLNKALENRVKIEIDGHHVKNARQVVLTLRNQGNAAVKRDDYDEPMKFVFVGSKILGSDLLATVPPELKNSINFSTYVQLGTDSAELEKILLNPNDVIALTFLLEGDYDQLNVGGRIIDGKIVEYVESLISSNTLVEGITITVYNKLKNYFMSRM